MLKRDGLNIAITDLRNKTGEDYRIAYNRNGTRASIRLYADTEDIFGITCTDGKIPLSKATAYANWLLTML